MVPSTQPSQKVPIIHSDPSLSRSTRFWSYGIKKIIFKTTHSEGRKYCTQSCKVTYSVPFKFATDGETQIDLHIASRG